MLCSSSNMQLFSCRYCLFHLLIPFSCCCRSVLCGGSTSIFVYGYCCYFYAKSDMTGLLQFAFFFGYNACICYAFFLMLGTIAFFSSLRFIHHLYSATKIEWSFHILMHSSDFQSVTFDSRIVTPNLCTMYFLHPWMLKATLNSRLPTETDIWVYICSHAKKFSLYTDFLLVEIVLDILVYICPHV